LQNQNNPGCALEFVGNEGDVLCDEDIYCSPLQENGNIMDSNIEALEQRYQLLYSDYQAGRIDEATFAAEVDKLQFQDNRGRYWMIGAQSGAWHYYDGQDWHQAEPREADNLPFVDEQGRYWQRGLKSGDWYYYNPDTKEWVKPGPTDESRPTPAVQRETRQARRASSAGYPVYQPASSDPGSAVPQFDGELFQDDEGRYWAIGAKTGQWYFYDYDGWHPAHEFAGAAQYPPGQPYQPQVNPAYPPQSYYAPPPQTFYQPQPDPWAAQGYVPPAYQPYPYPPQQPVYPQPGPAPQPPQAYAAPSTSQPAQPYPPQTEAPAQPNIAKMPTPPGGESGPGSWFYFDGKQWLQYSSGEPAETAAPPKMVIDQDATSTQEAKAAKPKKESKSEPVVAEFIAEEEPPVEVVDVEVITVIDPEPEAKPAPTPRAAVTRSTPVKEAAAPVTPLAQVDEVEPRRARRPSDAIRGRTAPVEPQRQSQERMPTDPDRPITPRNKDAAHEPTIIIPTGVTPATIAATSATPPVARASRPVVPQARRARENTVPMESPALTAGTPAPAAPDRRGVTQPMPQLTAEGVARSQTVPMPVERPARATQPHPVALPAAALPANQPVVSDKLEKSGFTFGDVVRSIPSTVWMFAGGLVVLVVIGLLIVGGAAFLNSGDTNVGGVAILQSPTPTLDAGPPNATPTAGPTPTNSPEPATTPTAFSMTTFSSKVLGITMDYPEGWQKKESEKQAVFSPSANGLDPANLKDVAFWVGIPTDKKMEIKDLLAEVLSKFPADAETLNEGTISIGSQTWTSAQIRFENKNLGGQGIATLAVTSKEGAGYYLVAAAPAESWNPTQPIFQGMINSFRFGSKEPVVAQATVAKTPQATKANTTSTPEAKSGSATKPAATPATTLEATRATTGTAVAAATTPATTPTPKATPTPLIYVVQSGDSLLAIANQFGVDVDTLAAKNDLDDPGKLSLGQELIIPFTAQQLAAFNGEGGSSKPAATESASGGTATAAQEPAEEPEDTPKAPAQSSAAPASLSGRIVYSAFNLGTDTFDLWLADVASGEQTGIASGASQPAFNKDGSLLAYRSWNLDTRGIFFRDFIGGRGGMVTRFVEDGLPTWSPDGFSFAFATRREGDRVPRIFKGDQQGQKDFSLNFQGEYPATFPDGRIVVKGCLPSGDCGIFILGANGGGETKISSEQSDTAPAVSPDGRRIAFMSSGRGGSNWEIWVMDATGANPRRLTDNKNNDGLPTWSPDGKSIAYVSDAGGVWAIWVMNADGSNQRKLFDMKGSPDGVVLRDRDNSKGWLEERISWAP
jgi:TolB protein